jgi:hypothetical protein
MRRGLNFETLFPIKDAASARLMLVKARCLLAAEVIREPEALEVVRRANAIRSTCKGGIDTSSHSQWRGSRRVGSSSLVVGGSGRLRRPRARAVVEHPTVPLIISV